MILRILMVLLLYSAFAAGAADIVPFNEDAPVIDGSSSDSVWKKQQWKTCGDLEFKASSDGTKIFLVVRFKASAPLCEERRWVWDKAAGIYVPGKDAEDTLNVILSPGSGSSSLFADLWVWRAGRTDPLAAADDLYISYDSERSAPRIFPDKGQASWYSRYFSDYAGDVIKRFYLKKPSGSAADVSAKGIWLDGIWTVEFSRKLDTGNIDDFRLSASEPFLVSFCVGRKLPEKFSFIPMRLEKEPVK